MSTEEIMQENRDPLAFAHDRRTAAAARYANLGGINVRARAKELGRIEALNEMIEFLETVYRCECQRKECRRRLELLRSLYQEVYEADVL